MPSREGRLEGSDGHRMEGRERLENRDLVTSSGRARRPAPSGPGPRAFSSVKDDGPLTSLGIQRTFGLRPREDPARPSGPHPRVPGRRRPPGPPGRAPDTSSRCHEVDDHFALPFHPSGQRCVQVAENFPGRRGSGRPTGSGWGTSSRLDRHCRVLHPAWDVARPRRESCGRRAPIPDSRDPGRDLPWGAGRVSITEALAHRIPDALVIVPMLGCSLKRIGLTVRIVGIRRIFHACRLMSDCAAPAR